MKVKGQAWYVGADEVLRAFDATDLVAVESGGIFVATALQTTQQTRGVCTGAAADGACASDADCAPQTASTNGVRTGVCDTVAGYCTISGWCPPEPASAAPVALQGVGNFTVYVRMYARFPKWEATQRLAWNNLDATSSSGPTDGWNLWSLTALLQLADVDLSAGDNASVWSTGADLVMTLELDCNLDARGSADDVLSSQCAPAYAPGAQLFRKASDQDASGWGKVYRLDTNSSLSVGANRRFSDLPMGGGEADTSAVGELTNRTLTKAYGVKLQVLLSGTGRKFDAQETVTHLGAGLALFGIATAVVDLLAVYFFPRRAWYARQKYDVADADAEAAADAQAAAPAADVEAYSLPLEGRARTRAERLLQQPLLLDGAASA